MSDDDLPLLPFGTDDEQLYTKEPYDFSKPNFSGIKIGCGKPEINSKTGNVSINCGDTLDERINPETGETEFLNYYCQECKDKFDKAKK